MFHRRAVLAVFVMLIALVGPAGPALARAPQSRAAQSQAPQSQAPQSQAPQSQAPLAPSDTTAGQQFAWLLDASGRPPVAESELRQHLSVTFLDAAGGPDGVNAFLASVGRLTLREVLRSDASRIEAVTVGAAGTFVTTLAVDAAGLVSLLLLNPYLDAPTGWAELDARVRALAPRASFAVSEIGADGRCRTVHAVDGTTRRPLGSVFKLYVLGALGDAVAGGRAAWAEPLAVRDEWKSLPTGVLQNEPAGTTLPLSRYAELMISISDNTATDHLMHRLGRAAVERQLVTFGHDDPRSTTPLLTTREFFALKLLGYPTLATVYAALPRAVRPLVLPAIGRLPLDDVQPWTTPRALDTVEWFGSPSDVCDAYAGLQRQAARPGGEPVARALSRNDGGIALDRERYPEIWFKGGSEVGVLDLTYRVRTSGGRVLVTSVMLSDPSAPLPDAAVIPEAQALIRGALALAG
ncbi:hypothetical protein GCM10009557_85460 [Virgisporangium ochraceum]|uniref:Beta-lactamase n=1 Tax=Virgisporangium ochraceum TaxID=65505 RepID=A0A8J4A0R9_9ACTN|nr:serine hydrolase [Virgisporangium ochraceum]GIJ73637.1 hypothetical protein Voc01_085540 [Virgisporangium ochraceum]